MKEPFYPSVKTECKDCGAIDSIFKRPEPPGKWSGLWECDDCGWTGYPKDFNRLDS